MPSKRTASGILCLLVLLLGSICAPAGPITVNPDLDQWAYHRLDGDSAGAYENAAWFTKHGVSGSEEDRATHYIAGFDLASQITPGLGAGNYVVNSARLLVTIAAVSSDSVYYDPTYDNWFSHLVPADDNYAADFVADSDAGRPFELHGLGFQNGYTGLEFDDLDAGAPAYHEYTDPVQNTAPSGSDVPLPFGRNAYALGFDELGTPIDVSNNVYGGFESNPWALGTVAGKDPGDALEVGDQIAFDIDLTNPGIRQYFQEALNAGSLGLVGTSMHQTGTDGFVRTHTLDTLDLDDAVLPQLTLDYQIVPEPGPLLLLGAGLISFLGWRLLFGRRTSSPTKGA